MRIKGIDGLPVLDAKRPVTVKITAADIGKADPKHPESCAAARACIRDLHVIEARVHLGRVYTRANKGNWVRYMTPKSLRNEIIAFDRGGTFEAGEFTLAVPPPSRAGGVRQGSDKPHRRGQLTGPRRSKPRIIPNVRTGPA